LLRLGHAERAWPLLRHRSDPRTRSYLLARLGVVGIDAQALWQRFAAEPDVSARRALLMGLGEFDDKELPSAQPAAVPARLIELYGDDPDPGIHGATVWLLRQWGQRDRLKTIDDELAKRDRALASEGRQPPDGRRWIVNGQGQTMVIVQGPVEFWMGS